MIPESIRLVLSNLKEVASVTIRTTTLIWPDCSGLLLKRYCVAILQALSTAGQTIIIALIANHLSSDSSKTQEWSVSLAVLFLLLAAVTGLPVILNTIQSYLHRILWFKLDEILALKLYSKTSMLDIAAHEDPKIKDIIFRATDRGVWKCSEIATRPIVASQQFISLILSTAIISISDWKLFALLFLGVIPELTAEIRYGGAVWGIWDGATEVQRRYWDIRHRFNDIPQIIEQRLYITTKHLLSIFRNLYISFQNKERAAENARLRAVILARLISIATLAVATFLFASSVVNGQIEFGTFLLIFYSISTLRSSLSDLCNMFALQSQDIPFVKDYIKILNIPGYIKHSPSAKNPFTNNAPEIVFENVSFSYPGSEQHVLNNVSFCIAPSEKVALIGINGAGKTTLIKLLCRFYDPTEGRILINGVDLREIELEKWYEQMGVLFQEYAHYKFTIQETIHLGKISEPLDPQKVVQAAKRSGANQFIELFPKKFDQQLGRVFSGGVEPSIGQWQKLALSRLFYRNPHCMILDEPTASIDAETEEHVFQNIFESSPKQSVLVISHRFSTVKRAQRIIVLKGGTITESGTHQELMLNDQEYARLFQLQAKGYVD